ncbi:hypothetical protein HPB49_018070 [Dermacentor silvarum]|uniref:Uncharacterized protein n=1 Tax=Dermacentor silvarum TaxID=543639 RepID=A0ACB8CSS5_DERSI|nr:hypothetical protein HPB49_018070 [Dermacentor silvarum]
MDPSAPSISTTSAPGGGDENAVYEELLPVLIQCFAIILLGYFSGRMGLIGPAETRSLNVFVSYFALPAAAFKSLAVIALGQVNWRFLAAVAIGKCVIFAVVAAVTLALVGRPASFAKAGLYAIAASQSNDFGLGYPLFVHLYDKIQPTFSHYVYLIAPIDLVFLNPIAFVMMEYGRSYEDNNGETVTGTQPATPKRGRLLSTLTGILVKNPAVVAPALGIVWNVSTSGATLPSVVEGILDSLSVAFIATALYLLGLSIIGNLGSMGKYAALTPVLLVTAKIVACPLVMRELVNLLGVGNNERDRKDFGNFGFLYGMLPMAPSVFLFATQYELPTAAVSTAMVAGTFLSAPFIFITATMSQMKVHSLKDFAATMGKTMVSSSAVSAACCLWLLVVLFRRRHRVTHGTTIYLVVCQLATALGGILWEPTSIDEPLSPLAYAQSVLSLAGIFASRVGTAILAGLLALLHWRSLCFVLRLKWLIVVAGFGSSVLVALLLCLSIPKRVPRLESTNPNFQFGNIQAVVAVTVLLTSLLFTVVSLVFQHRSRLQMRDCGPIGGSSDNDEQNNMVHSDFNSPLIQPSSRSCTRTSGSQEEAKGKSDECTGYTGGCADCANYSDEEHSTVPDLEDLISSPKPKVKAQRTKLSRSGTLSKLSCKSVNSSRFEFNVSPMKQAPSTSFDQLCGPQFNCDKEQVRHCISLIGTYNRQNGIGLHNTDEVLGLDSVVQADDDIHQVFRHSVLVLLLSISMVIGLAVSLWQLLLTDCPTGILVELTFVDIILNYGQGMLTFLVFGLDAKWLLGWLSDTWYFVSCRQQRRRDTPTLMLPKLEDLSPEARQICTQFHVYHRDSCITDICHSRPGPDGTELHLAFVGRDLVDWLLAVGLCQDRVQATRYGKWLLEGRVIAHVTGRHHFCDELYTYIFLPSQELDVSS